MFVLLIKQKKDNNKYTATKLLKSEINTFPYADDL